MVRRVLRATRVARTLCALDALRFTIRPLAGPGAQPLQSASGTPQGRPTGDAVALLPCRQKDLAGRHPHPQWAAPALHGLRGASPQNTSSPGGEPPTGDVSSGTSVVSGVSAPPSPAWPAGAAAAPGDVGACLRHPPSFGGRLMNPELPCIMVILQVNNLESLTVTHK